MKKAVRKRRTDRSVQQSSRDGDLGGRGQAIWTFLVAVAMVFAVMMQLSSRKSQLIEARSPASVGPTFAASEREDPRIKRVPASVKEAVDHPYRQPEPLTPRDLKR